jgi:hypothetical protein
MGRLVCCCRGWSVSLAWSNNNQIDDKLYALINNVQDLTYRSRTELLERLIDLASTL